MKMMLMLAATATIALSATACLMEWPEECAPSEPDACSEPELFCEGVPGEDYGYCVLPGTGCAGDAFSCDGDQCHPQGDRCNGIFNCIDGLDEIGCAPCDDNQIRCPGVGGGCFPRTARCDGIKDCNPTGVSADEVLCN